MHGDSPLIDHIISLKQQAHGSQVAGSGDTTDVMLDYVGYKLDDLRRRYKALVGSAVDLGKAEAERLNEALERGLTAYTYLSDEPLE